MQTLKNLRHNQQRVVKILSQAILFDKIHHAYVLDGSIFKIRNDVALAIASSLLCKNIDEFSACLKCLSCKKMTSGNHTDFIWIKPNEKNVIPIEAIRSMIQKLSYEAREGMYKVIVIENADAMNEFAQNSLLRTLEEPLRNTCFVLTLNSYSNLLSTVRSRLQHIRLKPPTFEEMVKNMEHYELDELTIQYLSRISATHESMFKTWLTLDIKKIIESLQKVFTSSISSKELLDTANDITSDKNSMELVLIILEMMLRDFLAMHYNVPKKLLYYQKMSCTLPLKNLLAATKELSKLHKMQIFHPHKLLSMENIFFALHK